MARLPSEKRTQKKENQRWLRSTSNYTGVTKIDMQEYKVSYQPMTWNMIWVFVRLENVYGTYVNWTKLMAMISLPLSQTLRDTSIPDSLIIYELWTWKQNTFIITYKEVVRKWSPLKRCEPVWNKYKYMVIFCTLDSCLW